VAEVPVPLHLRDQPAHDQTARSSGATRRRENPAARLLVLAPPAVEGAARSHVLHPPRGALDRAVDGLR
jgi:hypothetical protein